MGKTSVELVYFTAEMGENGVFLQPVRPYESDDSLYYFGRNAQTKMLLRKLHDHHFVAVVGSSGSGKSSLIRAGVIPQLEAGFLVQDRDQWQIARMKPGEAPLQHLVNELIATSPLGRESDSVTRQNTLISAIQEQGTQALLDYLQTQLKDTDNNLFILVDQFEELFRFGNEGQKEGDTDKNKQQQAAEFVALLLNLSQQKQLPIYVCLTMRSDFLGDCDAFKGLPEAINTSQFLVPRLTRNQRREVITNPVHLAGAKISSRLVDKLLNEDIHTRDDLPVLQHVLMRTFDAWQHSPDAAAGNPLDLPHYEQVHSIHKALDRHAHEAFEELNARQREIAKKLFQSLTTVDAGNRRIRRPAHLAEVCAIADATPQEFMAVIQCFRRDKRSFLVLSSEHIDDNPLIDISHESLIRQWEQLAEWVDTEASSAKTYRRLSETALLQQKGLANYYRDLDLEQALVWQQGTQPTEEWSKRYNKHFTAAIDFLEESQLDDQQRKDKALAEQKQQEKLLKEKATLEEKQRIFAEQQVQQQRKALVKSRWLSGIMAMLALAMVVIAAVAWGLSGKAKQNAIMAKMAEVRAVENEKAAEKARDEALAATEQTKAKILEANFYLAKSYEQKAMFALSKGDQAQQKGRNKSLAEYKKAWLYALEAEKLELPEDKIALKKASLVKLTNISSRYISAEKKRSPPPLT